MSRITLEEFYNILHKPKEECNGYDIHLQYCWKNNDSKSIFYLTGLNFMLGEQINNKVRFPSSKTIVLPPMII